MADDAERTYSLSIWGETAIYAGPQEWQEMSADDLCTVLADLTGYRADFLRESLPATFDHLGYASVNPANSLPSLNTGRAVPCFAIRSSDGEKMPKAKG